MKTLTIFMDVKDGIMYTDIPMGMETRVLNAMLYGTLIRIPTNAGDVTIHGKFIYAVKEVE